MISPGDIQMRVRACQECPFQFTCPSLKPPAITTEATACPLNPPRWGNPAPASPLPALPVLPLGGPTPDQWGPGYWKALHLRALAVGNGTDDSVWLTQFGMMIPCGECRNEWQRLVRANPPAWSDYFGWTVAVHNGVSAKKGKKTLTVAEAQTLWNGLV